MRLKDMVAVVTGAGSGLGRAMAIGFAGEGANVAILDLNEAGAKETAKEVHAQKRKALAIKADIGQPDQVKASFDRVIKELGRIDILVNNAGTRRRGAITELTADDWDFVMATNLRGPFLCIQAAAKDMVPRKYGKIINISSISAFRSGRFGAPYAASKAGLFGLTRTAAMELAEHHITVNCITPGRFATPFSEEYKRKLTPPQMEDYLRAIPLKREGGPPDIVGAAVFLASHDSDWITGAILPVDGGGTAGHV